MILPQTTYGVPVEYYHAPSMGPNNLMLHPQITYGAPVKKSSVSSVDSDYPMTQTSYGGPPNPPRGTATSHESSNAPSLTPSLEERRDKRRNEIVEVYSHVYGVAKIVLEILMAFGEVVSSPWKPKER